MRNVIVSSFIAMCAILTASMSVAAQAPAPEGTASISGRVTLQGRPFANAQVLLTAQPKNGVNTIEDLVEGKTPHKAGTDSDGHYVFTNLAAGPYEIRVFAPALVGTGHDEAILVGDGEAVEGIDFALTGGGVITGTITLADGRPAINKTIRLEPVSEQQGHSEFSAAGVKAAIRSMTPSTNASTDDRGVYRVYGVAAGDYLVGVHSGGGRHESVVTYYPSVTDKTKAVAVKVKPGNETTGIDVKVGVLKKGYEVRGRVADESGRGVAGLMIIYEPVHEGAGSETASATFPGPAHSNSKGEFRLEGVQPGRYSASIMSMFDESGAYADPVSFEVTNRDVSGVEIKTRKGLSVSGIAVIEGSDDPAVTAQLPQVQLTAIVMAAGGSAGVGMSRANVAPDGSFTLNGLRPGKLTITTNPLMQESRFAILRTERGGVAQNEGIEITPDNPVNDIKIVLGYRNCAIYGRASLSGGAIPKGAGLSVWIRRLASQDDEASSDRVIFEAHGSGRTIASAMGIGSGTSAEFQVSPGGGFRADALVPGDYEVVATATGAGASDSKSASQRVTLSSGAQVEVNLTLDLSDKKEK